MANDEGGLFGSGYSFGDIFGNPLVGGAVGWWQDEEYRKRYEQQREDAIARAGETREMLEGAGAAQMYGQEAGPWTLQEMQERFGEEGDYWFHPRDQRSHEAYWLKAGDVHDASRAELWRNPQTGGRLENRPGHPGVVGVADELRGTSADYYGGVGQRWDARTDVARAGGQDLMGLAGRAQTAGQTAGAGIARGYGERTQYGLQQLQGLGEQARTDINRRWDVEGQRQNLDLARRGLSNTGIRGGQAVARQRERGGELGTLDEQLRREQLFWGTGLMGDELTAAESRREAENLYWRQRIEASGAATGLELGASGEALIAGEGAFGTDWQNQLTLGLLSGATGYKQAHDLSGFEGRIQYPMEQRPEPILP